MILLLILFSIMSLIIFSAIMGIIYTISDDKDVMFPIGLLVLYFGLGFSCVLDVIRELV